MWWFKCILILNYLLLLKEIEGKHILAVKISGSKSIEYYFRSILEPLLQDGNKVRIDINIKLIANTVL